jgi:hypothetical protein
VLDLTVHGFADSPALKGWNVRLEDVTASSLLLNLFPHPVGQFGDFDNLDRYFIPLDPSHTYRLSDQVDGSNGDIAFSRVSAIVPETNRTLPLLLGTMGLLCLAAAPRAFGWGKV